MKNNMYTKLVRKFESIGRSTCVHDALALDRKKFAQYITSMSIWKHLQHRGTTEVQMVGNVCMFTTTNETTIQQTLVAIFLTC